MENNNNKSLATVLNEFKENTDKEITLISVHGIETIISKNDKLEEKQDMLHIIKENGELELITFTDNIFKIIIK